ncbi:MAG: shikimate dehydrogenase [Actinomycetota bacterium]|nr:shikimate dehydrogenase [Actinomycetota bacterium]
MSEFGERWRTRVGGTARTVGVIGWPVEESLSPLIHNTAFIALELDWVYIPLPVEPGRLAEALGGLTALGFAGANVTMPHKTEVADLVSDLSEDAIRLRAVNTLVSTPSGLEGHNTDAPGFGRFLSEDAGFEPAGRSALLFGAGGAARACGLSLARAGMTEITVAVRDASKAEGIRHALNGLHTHLTIVGFEGASNLVPDLVVNATPLGASGEELPIPVLGPESVVVDLLYRPALTPLQASAKKAGAAAFGGLGLLLHQAALSFELWTGQPAPLAAMSAAAIAEISEPA